MSRLTRLPTGIVDIASQRVGIYQSKMKSLIEMGFYSLVAYSIPFLLPAPQIILGTVVNSTLICGALYLRGKEIIPLLIFPSLGALSKGVLFGPLTVFLIYMVPFIWVGNAILILSIKALHIKMNKHYLGGVFIGSIFKAGFLLSMAFLLYSLGIVPSKFLLVFGPMQLATAISAGFAMWPINVLRMKIGK